MHRGILLALVPLCGAWMGSGHGDAEWSAGHGKHALDAGHLAFDAVSRVDASEAHTIATLVLPDADAVLTVRSRGEGRFALPHPRVDVQYVEYDAGGEVLFEADEVAGEIWVGRRRGEVAVELDVVLRDRVDAEHWRELARSSFEVRPVAPLSDTYYSGGEGDGDDTTVVVAGGCDEGWDSSDSDSDYDSDGGGCEGDDWDSGSDSGGGCEGDDVDSGGGGCEGCEGDAIAADGCPTRRRSPFLARALAWSPWLLVFGFVRLWRRMPR